MDLCIFQRKSETQSCPGFELRSPTLFLMTITVMLNMPYVLDAENVAHFLLSSILELTKKNMPVLRNALCVLTAIISIKWYLWN